MNGGQEGKGLTEIVKDSSLPPIISEPDAKNVLGVRHLVWTSVTDLVRDF